MAVRFFSVNNNPTEGTHLHLCWTSHKRTLADACTEMKSRLNPHSRAPMFYDFGPGDSDMRRLEALPCWAT